MTLNFKQSLLTLIGIAAIMVLGLFVIDMPIAIIVLTEAIFVGFIAIGRKIPYSELQQSMVASVNSFVTPILMLTLIGALVASWIIGGTVPTLIYIGMKIIDVRFFLIITFAMCSLMSMLIGTSWGVMSTLGVAFIGISNGLGIDPAYTVSAIVSGAFLGDKLSPLSSSLVLATELTGVESTKGIKAASYSNVPAFVLSIILYIYLGLAHTPQGESHEAEAEILMNALAEEFNLGILPLIAPVLLIFFMVIKIPTIPTFVLGIIVGVIESVFVQGCSLTDVASGLMTGYNMAANPMVNDLLHYGGVNSMASTLILLIIAACFGGIIKRLGIIACLLEKIFENARTKGKVITSAVVLHTVCFVITGNYYTTNSILAPAFADTFDKHGVSRDDLTAVLLNTGTGISPIIPWTATAIFITNTLGIAGTGYCIYAPILWLPVILQPIMAFMKKK
ncbi:MAG: hypothetical protein IJP00_00600 [Firmicutes bacterium]|nr:hypothetical protein [Bacillota bacterium]